ncbi:hypothetical protein ACFOZY_11810 [Chungangia koreensis]|uniref:Uncharacterized protein n=1 Tax=Chungangia koreensis TaxID=752657 RepID=A0ABV8X7N4_9LACT
MDILQLINEIRQKSDSEVEKLAKANGIPLSKSEIKKLRPLLEEFSFHWLIIGVPKSIIERIEKILGKEKANRIFDQLNGYKNQF